ncbi:MAG: M14 family murein peptide amidase A [Vulcanimicrobiota bacterium]
MGPQRRNPGLLRRLICLWLLLLAPALAQEVLEYGPGPGQLFPRYGLEGDPNLFLTPDAALAQSQTDPEWLEAQLAKYPDSRPLHLQKCRQLRRDGQLVAAADELGRTLELPDRELLLEAAELQLLAGYSLAAYDQLRQAGRLDAYYGHVASQSPFRELEQSGYARLVDGRFGRGQSLVTISHEVDEQGRRLTLGGHHAHLTETSLSLPWLGGTLIMADARGAEEVLAQLAPGGLVEEELGRSVEGRPIPSWRVGRGPETVWLLAGFHGDEPESTRLLQRFLEELKSQLPWTRSQRVIIVPMVNPDGLHLGQRVNANGVDLNRNYPAKNWTGKKETPDTWGGPNAASEPETQAVLELYANLPPSRIVSIHLPFKTVNFDGPAAELAKAMAVHNGYPISEDIGYPTPGSFGTYMGRERNIPTITLELPESDDATLWRENGPALWTAIAP